MPNQLPAMVEERIVAFAIAILALTPGRSPRSFTDNTDRVHHGRLTNGRIPADIVYGARKMETS